MRLGVALSKALARMHLWYPAAVVLAQTQLRDLDSHSIRRLSYVLMLSHRMKPGSVHALFRRIVEDNRERSPELTLGLAEMATRIEEPTLADDFLDDAEKNATASGDAFVADAAHRLRKLSVALQDGSLQTHIRDEANTITASSDGSPTVLVPLSGGYLSLFDLWIQQVRKHIGSRIVVLAMDDVALQVTKTYDNIHIVDCRSFFAWNEGKLHPKTRGVLWLVRTLYLRALVAAGHSVMVLDLDAIPVGDVLPLLASLPDADVIAQLDHSIPMDVDRALGFVLCCGFMLWRPTVAAQALLDRFAAAAQVERDDQLALNHLLVADGIVEKTNGANAMRFGSAGVQFACPDPSLVSRTLHTGSVVRHFHQQGQTIDELRKALGV
ncbi:putative nucleotide-diphospho-sugar transferase [Terriglobus roseus]|uniref:Nucleotide-diphospho-sugar transferase n=1 Tax=Terriglobus roseus TaxID=392734 RepID=A0A1G7NL85_9BACT|nr:putative nucleotide-diphospho-sugar transferase [Terriglobus roseus]SDF74773.1 Nucleotide-diphospho-sugar transferase [Terriglobus roseus]